jgi:hypothetical protein
MPNLCWKTVDRCVFEGDSLDLIFLSAYSAFPLVMQSVGKHTLRVAEEIADIEADFVRKWFNNI